MSLLTVQQQNKELILWNLITNLNFKHTRRTCHNLHEAIVRCKTHKSELKNGKEYKAIGCDKDGLYLVMDESYDCYFYRADIFEIVRDNYNILSHRSVYYNYHEQDVE